VVAAAIAHGTHRGFFASDFEFLRTWLTPAEQSSLTLTEQLACFLTRSFRVAPGASTGDAGWQRLCTGPTADIARDIVAAAETVNSQARQRLPQYHPDALSRTRIIDWFADHWRVPAADIELAALDRGLESVDVLVAAARPYYLLAKYNRHLVTVSVGEPAPARESQPANRGQRAGNAREPNRSRRHRW
jgi:hypothetical protein